jgi:hypothetical protein
MPKVLWKHRLKSNDVRILEEDDLPNSGFRSVYCFADPDAASFSKSGYAGFKGTVSSTVLFIDCDNQEGADEVRDGLKSLGLGFSTYATGRRGLHFHVPRVLVSSHLLPSMDKAFVQALSAKADFSFYHAVGFYRCIGAIHSQTGLKKTHVETVEGTLLDMANYELKVKSKERRPMNFGSMDSAFADHILQSLTVPLNHGERHKRLIEIGLALRRLNQPYDFAFVYVFNVNLMCEVPLPEEELHRLLLWVYDAAA